jgi:hypothetical protein
MKVIIETIPHSSQRYSTVGDWEFDEDGTLHIKVSDMGNDKYAFLVGIHEAIEAFICKERGIKEQDITNFDIQFEKEREAGKHDEEAEPGDSPEAPYREEHFFATSIERLLSEQLRVDWDKYEQTIINL